MIVLSVLSFYGVLFPQASGFWGRHVTLFLGWLAGFGRFVLPVLIGLWGGLLLLRKERHPGFLKLIVAAGVFISSLIALSLLGEHVWRDNFGGVIGLLGKTFLVRIFGVVGSWVVVLATTAMGVLLLTGQTPSEVFHKLKEGLKNDFEDLKKARQPAIKEKQPPVVPGQSALAPLPKKPAAPPKIMNNVAAATSAMAKPVAEKPSKAPRAIDKAPAVAAEKPAYVGPPLEIFDAAEGKQPVSKEELTSRARLLEQTLANFNIAANVVEIHPGPVITRYDLEPAPGVKVSSISSRADDLALAMKSTGIRVLAPIPGKGAVGVEIPNLHPERVGLQELLARPEFFNHPLSFGLCAWKNCFR
jgi:DNA segregation ATPase FtsK/SpoIIIE, S-DNA-T family